MAFTISHAKTAQVQITNFFPTLWSNIIELFTDRARAASNYIGEGSHKLYVPEYNDLENPCSGFCVPPAEIIRSLDNPWFQHISQIEIELERVP
jgi:hypothetical protein